MANGEEWIGHFLVLDPLDGIYDDDGEKCLDLVSLDEDLTVNDSDHPVLASLVDKTVVYLSEAAYFGEATVDYYLGDIQVSPDGNSLYVAEGNGSGGNYYIYQYTLTTPFDITSTTGLQTFIPSDGSAVHIGVHISSDGYNMYVCTASTALHQYTLVTPFAITTASYYTTLTCEQDTIASSMSTDGGTLFVLISTGASTREIVKYTLTTPFDLSSATLTTDSILSLKLDGLANGLFVNSSGTRLYTAGNNDNTIRSYTLSTEFNLSTAIQDTGTISTNDQGASYPAGVWLSEDETILYFGSFYTKEIIQYDIPEGIRVISAVTSPMDDMPWKIIGDLTGGDSIIDTPTGTIISSCIVPVPSDPDTSVTWWTAYGYQSEPSVSANGDVDWTGNGVDGQVNTSAIAGDKDVKFTLEILTINALADQWDEYSRVVIGTDTSGYGAGAGIGVYFTGDVHGGDVYDTTGLSPLPELIVGDYIHIYINVTNQTAEFFVNDTSYGIADYSQVGTNTPSLYVVGTSSGSLGLSHSIAANICTDVDESEEEGSDSEYDQTWTGSVDWASDQNADWIDTLTVLKPSYLAYGDALGYPDSVGGAVDTYIIVDPADLDADDDYYTIQFTYNTIDSPNGSNIDYMFYPDNIKNNLTDAVITGQTLNDGRVLYKVPMEGLYTGALDGNLTSIDMYQNYEYFDYTVVDVRFIEPTLATIWDIGVSSGSWVSSNEALFSEGTNSGSALITLSTSGLADSQNSTIEVDVIVDSAEMTGVSNIQQIDLQDDSYNGVSRYYQFAGNEATPSNGDDVINGVLQNDGRYKFTLTFVDDMSQLTGNITSIRLGQESGYFDISITDVRV